VFPWASPQAERLSLGYDPELLYVGAMFQDVGLLEGRRSKHERLEIDGANAAPRLPERHGLPEEHVTPEARSRARRPNDEIPARAGTPRSASDGTRTRDLRRDRPAL
jgi:hypothetical protein